VRRPMVIRSRAPDRRRASKCQGKWPKSAPRPRFGRSKMPVAVCTSRRSCRKAEKT
jgi:hypothetical protein